jgi:hypothetical protein
MLRQMDNPRYTPTELASIIGTTRKKSQVDWLSARNWRFDIDVNGRPVVLREFVASKLGAVVKPIAQAEYSNQPRPRFDRMTA